MTEMVYGSMPVRATEPVLPRWWRTIDKWSLTSILVLFGIGLLLGLAASVPLATRNGLDPFYYVQRQAFFGGMAIVAMFAVSMMSPDMVRRLGVLGFAGAFVALVLLPFFGTDFGKGAVRWFSFGFASVQPSEFPQARLRDPRRLAHGREPGAERPARQELLLRPHHRDRAPPSRCSRTSVRPHWCSSAGA